MKSAMVLRSINPENEELLECFSETSDAEIEAKLKAADQSYRRGLEKPAVERVKRRAQILLKIAERLEKNADAFARILTLEMGKTLASAKSEVLKCAVCCRHYAEHGPVLLASEPVEFDAGTKVEIHYEPIGIILAVMPWNFPFWQVFRCAAPILLSGNSMVLKHASNVPQSANAIEKIIQGAFLDAGEEVEAFSTLLISSGRIERLIQDDRVQGVTLTGSEGAGSKVASQAGASLKRTVLELGGSDPFILFSTADLQKALTTAVAARTLSNGQSCIAAKRFLVHSSLYDRFKKEMTSKMASLRIGSPLEVSTELGPLALSQTRADLHALVEDAVEKGAKLLTGGIMPEGKGFFYPGTVIEGITEKMKLYREEAFGPLASLYRFETLSEAIQIANATPFGLGSSVWTSDEKEIEACATKIQSGQVFVNALVSSDPRIPFGGVKRSGYGRELGSCGILEWVNIKSIVVKTLS